MDVVPYAGLTAAGAPWSSLGELLLALNGRANKPRQSFGFSQLGKVGHVPFAVPFSEHSLEPALESSRRKQA